MFEKPLTADQSQTETEPQTEIKKTVNEIMSVYSPEEMKKIASLPDGKERQLFISECRRFTPEEMNTLASLPDGKERNLVIAQINHRVTNSLENRFGVERYQQEEHHLYPAGRAKSTDKLDAFLERYPYKEIYQQIEKTIEERAKQKKE